MFEGVEIRGGAGEFEAAVIAIVLDQVAREQNAARQRQAESGPELPAWVRAVAPQYANRGLPVPSGGTPGG